MSTLIITSIVIGIVANLFLSHLVGKNGENRQIGYGTSFLVSFLFSPLIGLLLVLTSKELPETKSLDIPENENSPDNTLTTSLNDKPTLLGNIVAFLIFLLVLTMLYLVINH
jgi:MFS family permease